MLAKLLDSSKTRILRGVFSVSYLHDIGKVPVIKGSFIDMPEICQKFVAKKIRLMKPSGVFICDGSPTEYQNIVDEMVQSQMLKPLPQTGPGVFLARSDPEETKRVYSRYLICTALHSNTESAIQGEPPKTKKFARWYSRDKFSEAVDKRFPGCMKGRVMYVVPFSMGPLGGAHSINSVQVTDSLYAVAHMLIMYRVSSGVWQAISNSGFVEGIHSVGLPKPVTRKLYPNWLSCRDRMFIGHQMDSKEVWSFGSNSVENAVLGKECLSLRMASVIGREKGWLAEHMAIIGVTNPEGQEFFIGVSFPPGSGKTVTALMKPSLPGWRVRAVGNDVAWLRFNEEDGKMYAMNAENGMYGIACGTNRVDNPNILEMTSRDTIFTNIAETSDGRRWWQGIDAKGAEEALPSDVSIINWLGSDLGPMTDKLHKLQQNISPYNNNMAYTGARFAVRCEQVPNIHPLWENSEGVPLSAIVFGCRRKDAYPLVYESLSWKHGVLMAACLRSDPETNDRVLINNPMGMRPFLGYSFARYINHWLGMEKPGRKMPKIFFVNWYRRDGITDELLWPGFGENIRVLDWITRRSSQHDNAARAMDCVETQLGLQPQVEYFNLEGLYGIDWNQLMAATRKGYLGQKKFWRDEYDSIKNYLREQMAGEVPEQLIDEREAFKMRASEYISQ